MFSSQRLRNASCLTPFEWQHTFTFASRYYKRHKCAYDMGCSPHLPIWGFMNPTATGRPVNGGGIARRATKRRPEVETEGGRMMPWTFQVQDGSTRHSNLSCVGQRQLFHLPGHWWLSLPLSAPLSESGSGSRRFIPARSGSCQHQTKPHYCAGPKRTVAA